ncbi:MAG: hypothetical protein ACYDB7_04920 [Mycobacteriales bacterium]
MARDEDTDRSAIRRAAERCRAAEGTRNVIALSGSCGIPRSTLYRRYGDLVEDFRQGCARPGADGPDTVARLRSDRASLRDRDTQRLARIAELEAENHALRNAARLLRAENAELRAAHEAGRSARIVRLDQPPTSPDVSALSWEQLRAEHLALIHEHAETKSELARARQSISKLVSEHRKRQS